MRNGPVAWINSLTKHVVVYEKPSFSIFLFGYHHGEIPGAIRQFDDPVSKHILNHSSNNGVVLKVQAGKIKVYWSVVCHHKFLTSGNVGSLKVTERPGTHSLFSKHVVHLLNNVWKWLRYRENSNARSGSSSSSECGGISGVLMRQLLGK